VSRLWDKGLPLDQRVLQYTAGEDSQLDARLVAYDVKASIAHAEMLRDQKLLSAADYEKIRDGLAALGDEFAAGKWQIRLEDEDVHTALESRLIDRVGDAGGRIHLGRSRNDQVLTALRLYLLDACGEVQQSISDLLVALDALSERHANIALPGYTHMQPAMPSSVAWWVGGYREAFNDATEGLESARRRIDKNPLGSAAGYGAPGLPLDRDATTRKLGFTVTQQPVTAVQLSRGKAESGLVFELTLLLADLGRMASDLLLFYTREFAYITLAADVTTGSSIMPQKRNPDVLELIRASSSTAQACLDECLMITAKLPSGYQRDLQRLKPPVFRAIDLSIDSVDIMSYLVSGLKFVADNIQLDPSLNAAQEANDLVALEGIPFREAYRRIAARYLAE
jgi:argininosuccinate lyase